MTSKIDFDAIVGDIGNATVSVEPNVTVDSGKCVKVT